MKKVMKFGSEVVTGKDLSVWPGNETGKIIDVYKCKLSQALLYLADTFMDKLKPKWIVYRFLQIGFKYKKNSRCLLKKFPCKS